MHKVLAIAVSAIAAPLILFVLTSAAAAQDAYGQPSPSASSSYVRQTGSPQATSKVQKKKKTKTSNPAKTKQN